MIKATIVSKVLSDKVDSPFHKKVFRIDMDHCDLAGDIVGELGEKCFSMLPFAHEEVTLIADRYMQLGLKIREHSQVSCDECYEGGLKINGEIKLEDFDDIVQLSILHLADAYEAHPICMAIALAMFPYMWNKMISLVNATQEGDRKRKLSNKYKQFNRRSFARAEANAFRYTTQ